MGSNNTQMEMNNYSFMVIILFINLFFPSFVWSQSNTDTVKGAAIQLMARSQEDKVLLRWAVDTPLEWQKANTYGFYLDKYVYKRNGQRLAAPEKVNLSPIHIKADPVEAWKDIVEKDNYAAIIAQALYGEGFEVTGTNDGEIARIVNLAQELEQRFSFALFAADMNFEAAIKAGWGYVDTDVKPGEEYVYQVKTAIPSEIATVKSASATASTDDFEPLPQPVGLQGIWGDKNVLLTWEYELFKTVYTSYNVERSKDGKNFTELSPIPLVNLNDKPEAPAKRMYYIDSLVQNDTKYHYRVYGISSFGEKGPYSDIISGEGSPTLVFSPRISGYEFTENQNEAIIKWEYPEEGENRITKFTMTRADKDSGSYEVIFDSIPVHKREILYSKLNPSNYIKIAAIGRNNQQKESFSSFIQPIDSIPPDPPVALEGTIDSLGQVTINWDKNTEKDLYGYRIFRKNLANEEFVQLTVDPIQETAYTDSVQLKSLNNKVYYSIIAVDKRFNQSGFSEALIMEKPDVVPPTSPIFTGYRIENGHVVLEWECSTETGATHYLYRKDLTENTSWDVVYSTSGTLKTYTDKKTAQNHTYRYAIMAKDKNGLESEPSTPVTVTVVNMVPQEQIKSLSGYADREQHHIELHWKLKDQEQIAEVTIYKNAEGQPPVTYKVLPPHIVTVKDNDINPNNTYSYQLRATMKNGAFSKLESIAIKY